MRQLQRERQVDVLCHCLVEVGMIRTMLSSVLYKALVWTFSSVHCRRHVTEPCRRQRTGGHAGEWCPNVIISPLPTTLELVGVRVVSQFLDVSPEL